MEATMGVKILPIESAYAILCRIVGDLPTVPQARRDELLLAVCVFAEGFAHVIRRELPKERWQAFLPMTVTIGEATKQLLTEWPDQAAYTRLHSELGRFIMILLHLRGKNMFEHGDE